MTVRLRDIRDCFEGVIPSIIATCDARGIPNVSYLSQVYYVDDGRVALSNQFFSKTAANVRATGRATVLVVDARSGAQHVLSVAFESSVEAGELFERMAAHLRAISSQHGMEKLMALKSADIYRVLGCRPVAGSTPPDPPAPRAQAEERLAAAARLSAGIGAEPDADCMLDRTLDGLAAEFGFANLMVLVADEELRRLTVLASRGYETEGVGSEVCYGEGVIGIAAESRHPVRICDMSRGRRFAQAVRSSAELDGQRVIPLPGLPEPQSQLAVPMLSHGRLRGILFAESPERFRFAREDEHALALVAAQLAAGLRLDEMEAQAVPAVAEGAAAETAAAGPPSFRVRYFAFDDSVFIDDAYLIKGVSGRLLFHFIDQHLKTGRREFTNRELRLDPALRLPGLKDNLETRLILLRRRLEERDAPIRLLRPGRGRIRLDLSGRPGIEIVRRM
jgi:adenylate cyclase